MNANRLFVCPDLHEARNLEEVETAIRREEPTRTIFLGDYFDQFDDTPGDAALTAIWLKESLGQPNRVHLWGNHDLAYGFPDIKEAYCSGFTAKKSRAINAILGRGDWEKLKLSHWEGDFLFTHAGWSDDFPGDPSRSKVPDREALLRSEEMEAWQCLKRGSPHWIWGVGYIRGGTQAYGGLLWCDLREFTPIPGLSQIFGHTSGNLGTMKGGRDSFNLCLDTCSREQGAQHYLLIEDGCVQLKRLDGLLIKTEGCVGKTKSKPAENSETSIVSAPISAATPHDYLLARVKKRLGAAPYEGLRVELIVDIVRLLQLPIADVITALKK